MAQTPASPKTRNPARGAAIVLSAVVAIYCGAVGAVLLLLFHLPATARWVADDRLDPLLIALVFHGAGCAAGGLALRRLRRTGRVAAAAARWMLVLAVLGFVASMDVLLGVAFPPRILTTTRYDLHPIRGWTNRPLALYEQAGTTLRMDARGMRVDAGPAAKNEPAAPSILFIGDSITMGWAVRAGEAYGPQTVEILRHRHAGLSLAALNGGTCGYDTRQEYDWYLQVGQSLKPNLVVLQFCLNDIAEQFDPATWQQPHRHGAFIEAMAPSSWSGIARALGAWRSKPRAGTGLIEEGAAIEEFEIQECLDTPDAPRVARAWQGVLSALDRLLAACRRAGTPMILVCFPTQSQFEAPAASTAPQERLAEWAARNRVPLLDLLPAYRRFAAAAPDERLYSDFLHPTARGHRVAAEELARFIDEKGILDVLLAGERRNSLGPSD